jgi:hypothetical protein
MVGPVVYIAHVSSAPVKVLGTARGVDGRWWAFASDGDAVRRWVIGPDGPPDVVYGAQARFESVQAIAPAGGELLVAGCLGAVWRWDLATGRPFGDPIQGRGRWGRIPMGDTMAVFDLDGRPTVVTGGGYHLRCWDLRTGDVVGERWRSDRPEGQVRVMVAASVLPDGTPVVLSGGFDGVVRRWDLRTGTAFAAPMRDCGRVFHLVPVCWPDGRAVVCVVTRDVSCTAGTSSPASRSPHRSGPPGTRPPASPRRCMWRRWPVVWPPVSTVRPCGRGTS